MSGKKIITVFGATGKQGGSIVQKFLHDPKLKNEWAVRGVSRNAEGESAKKLSAQGVEMVSGDMNDKDSLVKAMEGAFAVFAVTNYWEKMDMQLEIDQGKKLADAAKETDVQHFIWSSLLNVNKLTNGKLPNVYHFDSKALVEDYVRKQGIPATFFMPGFFLSNLSEGMFRPMPDESNANVWTLALPVPATAPFPMFDVTDTGKWIKGIVLNRDTLLGKQVYAATAYLTPTQLVDQFKAVFPQDGATARFVEVPHAQFLQGMKDMGLPDFAAQEMLENMRLMDEGGYFGGAALKESQAILDDELTTWEEFMKGTSGFASLK